MAKKKERTDITIDNGVATWSIGTQGKILGTYAGTFKFKCYLMPSQKLAAGREFRELIGQHHELATEKEKFTAFALAQLKQRIISAPPWWVSTDQPGDIPDEDVLTAILDAALDAEVKFIKDKQKEKEENLAKARKAAEKILEDSTQADEEEEEGDEGQD